VKLPSALLRAADLEEGSLSEGAARLLALELYREDKVSLGRAAELCHTPLAPSWISLQSTVSLRYDTASKTWKKNAGQWIVSKRDCRIRFVAAWAFYAHGYLTDLRACFGN